jgi:hypothetical protein
MLDGSTNKGNEDECIKLLNSNYIERFSTNYLNKLNIYIDDEIYNEKITTLPPLKSITILKIEKMIKKEKLINEKKKLKELKRLGQVSNAPSKKNLPNVLSPSKKIKKFNTNNSNTLIL